MAMSPAGPSLTVPEVEAHLERLGIKPFRAIVDHLTTLNGADGEGNHFVTVPGEEDVDVDKILGLGYPEADLEDHYGMFRRYIPAGWVPIAVDSFGNAFLVSPAGGVRFWDHETHRSTRAFSSIPAFLAAIQYEAPPEPTGPDWANETLTNLRTLVAASDDAAYYAGWAGRADFVGDLLAANPPDRVYRFLVGACVGDQVETVEALYHSGVDMEQGPPNDMTPLMAAACGESIGVARFLLDPEGPAVDPRTQVDGEKAVQMTAWSPLVDLLLQAMDDWNRRD